MKQSAHTHMYVRMYLKKTVCVCAWNTTYTHCTYVHMHLFHLLLHIMLQDLMVDENIHKLEVRRLRETLFARADDVLSLEKRKLHLHTVSISNVSSLYTVVGRNTVGVSKSFYVHMYVCVRTSLLHTSYVCRYRILCMCT